MAVRPGMRFYGAIKNLGGNMRFITIVSALLLSLGAAVAQDYPSRPITVLVPYAAGGPTDTIARLTAASMAKSLGQQMIVENATGAGGTIGTTRAPSRTATRCWSIMSAFRPRPRCIAT